MNKYFVVYKPFNVLSQFTHPGEKKTLKDIFELPPDVYSVGRLDYDSEGLLIITNDKLLNFQLLNPLQAHEREYWVQVEGNITDDAIHVMQDGVDININGKIYRTKKCIIKKIIHQPPVAQREPPIRYRKSVAESWIKIIITEGKNRQIRRMTAKVGFPVLRLIRYRIEKINADGLQPREMKILSQAEMYNLLNINKRK